MRYDIILYDLESKTESITLNYYKTHEQAVRAVKKYRKQGIPAFYRRQSVQIGR